MDASEVCPLCDEKLSANPVVEVSKGLGTLTSVSERLDDGICNKWIGKSKVTVHKECRKNYTREDTVKAKLKRKQEEAETSGSKLSPLNKKLRSETPAFNFKEMCLFCGKVCDEKREKKLSVNRRKKIHHVATLELREKILNTTSGRNDDLAKQVRSRVGAVSDLVAEEARYHNVCMTKFFKEPPQHEKPGRPEDEKISNSFRKICDTIENSDDYQFSLKKLMVDQQVDADKKKILKRLSQKYGDRIVLTEIPRKDTILCFRDSIEKILTNAWYNSKSKDEKEERMRIIIAAAKI